MISKVMIAFLCLGLLVWFGLRIVNFKEVPSLTMNTKSSQLQPLEVIPLLERYVISTLVQDAAYHIVYYDNSQGVPGPSDWDMKIVVKVSRNEIAKWFEGYSPAEDFDVSWGMDWIEAKDWQVTSEPEFYTAAGGQMAVFDDQGILIKQLSTY